LAAAQGIPAAAIGFSVTPELPVNQRENTNSFFDLLVSPGQEQELFLTVNNSTDADIVVSVEALTATTTLYGDINYSSRGESDATLLYSLEDLVRIPEENITVPANSSASVPIFLTSPPEAFEGIILGSFLTVRHITDEERELAGAIVNQYAFSTPVRLMNSEEALQVPADFLLGEVAAELVHNRASIVANVINPQPKLIRNAVASAHIFPAGSTTPVFELELENVDFAPNSIFQFSIIDEAGTGVRSGDYTARITIAYQGETWVLEQSFTITEESAAAINELAVNQGDDVEADSSLNLLLIAAIAAGSLLLLTVVIIVVVVNRKRKPVSVADLMQEYERKHHE
jgi:hypothetical protein